MRAGVVDAAGAVGLQGLPVPTAGKARVFEADLDNLAQLAAGDDLLDLLEGGGEERLVEGGDDDVILLGSQDEILALEIGAAEGLLGEDIEAVGKQVTGDGVVHLGEGCVDDQIDIGAAEEIGVVGDGIAAELGGGLLTTGGIGLNDADNFAEIVVLAAEEAAVDIASAAALTDDGNAHFFHKFSFLLWK